MALKNNCGRKSALKGHSIATKSRLSPSEVLQDVYEGKRVIKLPVVMARSDVVMNGALIPQDELIPESWDGVPVTWGHPNDGQGFISAQTPQTLSEWSIGRIFNSRVDGQALKAEAWIEVDRAMEIAPGFIETLLTTKSEMPIDVSTGYFSRDEDASGEVNGRPYTMLNRDVKPNHLAILAEEDGACSWADGCGLRSNIRRRKMTTRNAAVKFNKKTQTAIGALQAILKGGSVKKSDVMLTLFANERGQDDDRRQIIADLISRDDSPYTPDDEQSLMMMSDGTLRRMKDDYLTKAEAAAAAAEGEGEEEEEEEPEVAAEGSEEEEDPEANAEGDEEEDPDKMKDNATALPKTQAQLTGIINKVVAAAIKKNSKAAVAPTINVKALAKELTPLIFTPEIQAALALSTNQVKTHRLGLIDKIVANTTITKEAAEKMDAATLEVVANGILPPASFVGRQVTSNEAADEDDEAVAAMTSHVNIRDEMTEAREKRRGGARR